MVAGRGWVAGGDDGDVRPGAEGGGGGGGEEEGTGTGKAAAGRGGEGGGGEVRSKGLVGKRLGAWV